MLFDLFTGEGDPVKDPANDPVKDPKKDPEKEAANKLLLTTIPGSDKKTLNVVGTAAKTVGIDPRMLGASFFGEGGELIFNSPDAESDAFWYAKRKGKVGPKFNKDGFYFAGLDNWEDVKGKLKQYLPADFEDAVFDGLNEQTWKKYVEEEKDGKMIYKVPKQWLDDVRGGDDKKAEAAYDKIYDHVKRKGGTPNRTVAFKNFEDMILAKGAYLRMLQDQTVAAAKKRGVKVEGDLLNYLTMSAYNGGLGAALQLLDDYKAGNKDIMKTGTRKFMQVHNNLQRRMKFMMAMNDSFATGFEGDHKPFPPTGHLVNQTVATPR
jgi:hypothetical protein